MDVSGHISAQAMVCDPISSTLKLTLGVLSAIRFPGPRATILRLCPRGEENEDRVEAAQALRRANERNAGTIGRARGLVMRLSILQRRASPLIMNKTNPNHLCPHLMS